LVGAIHYFRRFTNFFPDYQLFGMKWWKKVLCKIQDGDPLKLKDNAQRPTTEQDLSIVTNLDPS
jgi:hypothetical protein